jgi:hypothetical protein
MTTPLILSERSNIITDASIDNMLLLKLQSDMGNAAILNPRGWAITYFIGASVNVWSVVHNLNKPSDKILVLPTTSRDQGISTSNLTTSVQYLNNNEFRVILDVSVDANINMNVLVVLRG